MHPHWTEKLRPADPERLAKRAITLLEQHLKTHYGLNVEMGAELEFGAFAPPSHPLHTVPGKPPKLDAALYRPFGDRTPQDEAAHAYYAHSPYISSIHREALKIEQPYPCNQYELVFSHQGDFGTYGEGRFVNLGRAIAREKSRLLKDPQLEHVTFAPQTDGTHEGDYLMNGLHLNISLKREDGTSPLVASLKNIVYGQLLRKRKCIPTPESEWLIRAISRCQREGQYMLGATPDHLDRVGHLQMNNDVYCLRSGDTGIYLENRAPAADANPYYAIMLLLAGVVHGLESQKNPEPGMSMIASSSFTCAQDFKTSTALIPLLNRLEPELGDQLRESIEYAHSHAATTASSHQR